MITIYLTDKTEAYTKEELFAKVEALQGKELEPVGKCKTIKKTVLLDKIRECANFTFFLNSY